MKKLDLYVKKVSGTTKEGKEYEFVKYFVKFNSIEIPLEVKDKNEVSKQILELICSSLPDIDDENENN